MTTKMTTKILSILFLFTTFLNAQSGGADFEFGRKLTDEFYYEFVEEQDPTIDLSKDKYFAVRKAFKIRQIIIRHLGLSSIDSLFGHDSIKFREIGLTMFEHNGYSYSEILTFDKNGFLITVNKFPISKKLNRFDTIFLMRNCVTSKIQADTTVTKTFFNNVLTDTKVYTDKIHYHNFKRNTFSMRFDSVSKKYVKQWPTPLFNSTKFYYNNDGKIHKIKRESPDVDYYDISFRAINKNVLIVNCTMYSAPGEPISHYENEIIKKNNGRIITSKFYNVNAPKDFSTYTFTYDKYENLTKVIRLTKADAWFEYTDTLYEYRHAYSGNKLAQTTINYGSTKDDHIVVRYYPNTLVKERDYGKYKRRYEYHYFDK